VIVIPPESDVSTYMAMTHCDSVIIYNTKTGVELTSMGIPVIVAGEAWIRNKGFSIDVTDETSYRSVLDGLPLGQRMKDADVEMAKKYAYHFFFRRMIEMDFFKHVHGNPPFSLDISSIRQLNKGGREIDIVCDGVMSRGDFVC